MAGDWIKIENTTPDKPEIFIIADQLEIDPDAVVGKLARIWIWADQQTYDGHACSVTRALLDRVTNVTGFADAMIEAGWLIEAGDGLMFPNFEQHNGETAKTRALAARRSARRRKKVTQESRSQRDESNAGCVTKSAPREEKRRDIGGKPPSRTFQFTEPDMQLAEFVWSRIVALQPNRRPPNLESWANDIRLMREQDNRDPADIRVLFEWVNRDSFWQTNILSPSKLREKFDDLDLKRRKAPTQPSGTQNRAQRTEQANAEVFGRFLSEDGFHEGDDVPLLGEADG